MSITTTADLDFTPSRVKDIRVRLGLTQQQFADLLRVGVNSVTRWEKGHGTPTRGPILKKLLDAEAGVNGV
jgi:DNA-binding transcriptional regulator YiaG